MADRGASGVETEAGPQFVVERGPAGPVEEQAVLDHFASAVARLLDVPVVLVTTAEGERQRMRGASGLSGSVDGARMTLGVTPYCRRVLDSGRPVIVHDTRRHHVREHDVLGAVGYAGFPLTVDGAAGGVLSVLDQPGRRWSDRDIAVLRAIAPLGAVLLAPAADITYPQLEPIWLVDLPDAPSGGNDVAPAGRGARDRG